MRVILGQDDQSEFRLEIPDDATLTFGPNAPYANKETSSGRTDGWSLRIYGPNKTLLACLTNTKWFREEKIIISRLVEKVATESVWRNGDGTYEHKVTTNTTKQLVQHTNTGMGYVSTGTNNDANKKKGK